MVGVLFFELITEEITVGEAELLVRLFGNKQDLKKIFQPGFGQIFQPGKRKWKKLAPIRQHSGRIIQRIFLDRICWQMKKYKSMYYVCMWPCAIPDKLLQNTRE